MKKTRFGSYLVGQMPDGCRLCTMGAKLVLFVTGLCNKGCFYCPLSPERKDIDISLANERPVRKLEDITEEAMLMDALGTGLTGGDPLVRPDRTVKYIELLKREFGRDHHIHLYTAQVQVSPSMLRSLKRSGLDEIRFHAMSKAYERPIRAAVDAGLDVGVEVPAIPGQTRQLMEVAKMADEVGCRFMNINELEACESTVEEFQRRGLRVISDESMAVDGSLETALDAALFCEAETGLNVHVCPSSLKDGVQLKERLGRIARNVKKPYELIDEDNLLVKVVITPRRKMSQKQMSFVARWLREELDLDPELIQINQAKGRIETHPDLSEQIAAIVDPEDFEVALIEEYPTWDRLETEVVPLN